MGKNHPSGAFSPSFPWQRSGSQIGWKRVKPHGRNIHVWLQPVAALAAAPREKDLRAAFPTWHVWESVPRAGL